jgi:hypothetical protein
MKSLLTASTSLMEMMQRMYSYEPPRPKLRIGQAFIDFEPLHPMGYLYAYQPFTAKVSFSNTGTARTVRFKIRWLLDGGVVFGEFTVNTLYDPGEGDTVFWTFYNGLPGGEHNIKCTLDYENRIGTQEVNIGFTCVWQ